MSRQNLKKETPSYSYIEVEGLSDAYEQMHLYDEKVKTARQAPLFINLDDAYALSQSSAGFRPEYFERLLYLVDRQSEKTACYLKYGAFDWGTAYNCSAFDALKELVHYIQNTNPQLSLVLILPKGKDFVRQRIEEGLDCKLIFTLHEGRCAA